MIPRQGGTHLSPPLAKKNGQPIRLPVCLCENGGYTVMVQRSIFCRR